MHNNERLPEARCLNLTRSNITLASECEEILEYQDMIFTLKDMLYALVDYPVMMLKDIIDFVLLNKLLVIR
jgi:hypothetical protein